jgi:hypothetical protein
MAPCDRLKEEDLRGFLKSPYMGIKTPDPPNPFKHPLIWETNDLHCIIEASNHKLHAM